MEVSMGTKEKILYTSLQLFSKQGISATSLSQIAKEVGIKKPSIYNHFENKDTLIQEMYEFYREKAVKNNKINLETIEEMINTTEAFELLQQLVDNYEQMYNEDVFQLFWILIHVEKFHDKNAYMIFCSEAERMLEIGRWLFEKLVEYGKISADNDLEGKIISFTYSIQSLQIEKLMHKSMGRESQFIDKKIERLIMYMID